MIFPFGVGANVCNSHGNDSDPHDVVGNVSQSRRRIGRTLSMVWKNQIWATSKWVFREKWRTVNTSQWQSGQHSSPN